MSGHELNPPWIVSIVRSPAEAPAKRGPSQEHERFPFSGRCIKAPFAKRRRSATAYIEYRNLHKGESSKTISGCPDGKRIAPYVNILMLFPLNLFLS
jgi:hypothetical protein